MNYFQNRLFARGFSLILVGGALSILVQGMVFQITAAVLALIGFISMMYGISQLNKKAKEKK